MPTIETKDGMVWGYGGAGRKGGKPVSVHHGLVGDGTFGAIWDELGNSAGINWIGSRASRKIAINDYIRPPQKIESPYRISYPPFRKPRSFYSYAILPLPEAGGSLFAGRQTRVGDRTERLADDQWARHASGKPSARTGCENLIFLPTMQVVLKIQQNSLRD